MTDGGGGEGISERELTCAICTEILYQPLTLLDCLHTFCGACLKEWFKWQATSASSSRRGTSNPYTCPSCRESVRRTKADWRLNSLLEGFLKVHPDKAKTDVEKKELESHYKPGDDVLPTVPVARGRYDSQDERMLAAAREMSLQDQGRERGGTSRSRQEHGPRLTEATLRSHDTGQPQIEHQPSLRSLLSASDENSQDVQAEILRSIYSEGLLEGIDLDNLTAEQEEELTEKIAEAYRRRHRHRERSGNRERQRRESRSPRSNAAAGAEGSPNSRPATRESAADGQQSQQQTRSRPPVSRPHLFEQTLESPARTQQRSRSSVSQRSGHSDTAAASTPPGTRSATDLSQTPSSDNAQRERRSRVTSSSRSITEPQPGPRQSESPRLRHANTAGVQETSAATLASSDRPSTDSAQRPTTATNTTSTPAPQTVAPLRLQPLRTVRPALSNSAFAPEPIEDATDQVTTPSINCNRCSRPSIQHSLHYNCRWCLGGGYNLCLPCYRAEQGCNHWFGFGYRALERWRRTAPPEGWPIGFDRPHIMSARRYLKPSQSQQPPILEEGAFCDTCLSFANDGYWHCGICLEGAWGFCDTCVKQGKHCTHPLTYVAHLNSLQGGQWDPAKMAFVGTLPHLRQDSYVHLPVDTGCDVCSRSIPAQSTRLHCCQCNAGDYDVCFDCYRGLVAQGKISERNGLSGWRRCLDGHRLAVVGFQDTPEGGHVRITIAEPVGGVKKAGKDDSPANNASQQRPPPDSASLGLRCLALWSYFPAEGVADQLAFPKYAELREVERLNEDWFEGAYAGERKLVPAGHVRVL